MTGTGRPALDCGDLDMHIAADGSWFYRGSRIDRLPLVKLFASVLRREADGSYWLVTPVERGRVIVDDAPFLAVEMEVVGTGNARTLRLRTNLDDWVNVDADHPLRTGSSPAGDLRIYVGIGRGLEAQLSRPVWYDLIELALSDGSAGDSDHAVGIWAGGQWFDLSALTEPAA